MLWAEQSMLFVFNCLACNRSKSASGIKAGSLRARPVQQRCAATVLQDGGWFEGVVTDYSALDRTHW